VTNGIIFWVTAPMSKSDKSPMSPLTLWAEDWGSGRIVG